MTTPSPPLTSGSQLPARLADQGWAVLSCSDLLDLADLKAGCFQSWRAFWNDLPPDTHLRDGGRYRRRRHGCFTVSGNSLQRVRHRAHWQPIEYNVLHGGIERWFEPLAPALVDDPSWTRLLLSLGGVADGLRAAQRWFVEAHPFRIEATDGIGRPTPEGAHRDGVDLVAVLLLDRHNIKGGETRVFEGQGPQGMRFTLAEPGSVLLLDDESVIHESTPIQPVDAHRASWRDTLVLTYRRQGFQGPPAAT